MTNYRRGESFLGTIVFLIFLGCVYGAFQFVRGCNDPTRGPDGTPAPYIVDTVMLGMDVRTMYVASRTAPGHYSVVVTNYAKDSSLPISTDIKHYACVDVTNYDLLGMMRMAGAAGDLGAVGCTFKWQTYGGRAGKAKAVPATKHELSF